MPATVLDIGDSSISFPEFLVLDASVILELIPGPGRPHPHHALAVNFLNRLRNAAQQGEVIPILPLLAFEECLFKICKGVLSQFGRLAGEGWHEHYKANPLAIRSAVPAINSLHTQLSAFPVLISEPEDLAAPPRGREPQLSQRLPLLIDQFAILPKDATIFSEAERLGVDTLATLDSDWSRAGGFTVFAPV